MTREADLSVSDNGGSLFLVTKENVQLPEEKIANVSISNGLAWSKDDKKFFFIDSATRKIVRYNFDVEHGTIGELQIHIIIEGLLVFNLVPIHRERVTICSRDKLKTEV